MAEVCEEEKGSDSLPSDRSPIREASTAGHQSDDVGDNDDDDGDGDDDYQIMTKAQAGRQALQVIVMMTDIEIL